MAFAEAKRIKAEGLSEVNSYSSYSNQFTIPDTRKTILLRVAVSGTCRCLVNGQFATFGQHTDFPRRKTYTETDITPFCRAGINEIRIDVYFSGNAFSSHTDGSPGMIAEIIQGKSILLSSSEDWTAILDTRYAMGKREVLSSSLNYTFEYDANRTPELRNTVDAGPFAVGGTLKKRPVPPPELGVLVRGKVLSLAQIYREAAEFSSIGDCFDADRVVLSEQRANGISMLFDLGMEYAGLLTLDITAPAGTIIDIAHGEYLSGDHVRALFPGNRNFADRYIAMEGRNAFRHDFRRIACRFLELHIIGRTNAVKVHMVGLTEVSIPGMECTSFTCSDVFFETAHKITADTLRLCLHEKFENCPWREQSICEYDARNQMLFGYPLWGNYKQAAEMLQLFADSVRESGHLVAAVPNAWDLVIPAYTFLWISAVRDYTMYSGSFTLFRHLKKQIRDMLNKILAEQKNGLYTLPESEPHLWNYCEAPLLEMMPNPPNAFYNLYLHEALQATAEMFRLDNDPDTAEYYEKTAAELGCKLETTFFQKDKGCLYADHFNDKGQPECFHGHIQMLFLERGLVPIEKRQRLLAGFLLGELEMPALGALPYLIRAFMQYATPEERLLFHYKLKAVYDIMIKAGTKTWWEVLNGKEYGGGAGSLCHGWSAGISYYESSYLLGVTPLEPGFRKFSVKPYPGDVKQASGNIHTSRGLIRISWECRDNKTIILTVKAPKGCTPVIESYPEYSVTLRG